MANLYVGLSVFFIFWEDLTNRKLKPKMTIINQSSYKNVRHFTFSFTQTQSKEILKPSIHANNLFVMLKGGRIQQNPIQISQV